MAYNLRPLIQILEHYILDEKKLQLESLLLKKVTSLYDIFEKSPLSTIDTRQSLMSQIIDAAHKAQDLIESHILDETGPAGCESFILSPPDLQHVIDEFDNIMKIMDQPIDNSSDIGSFTTDPCNGSIVPNNFRSELFSPDQGTEIILAGREDEKKQLINCLTFRCRSSCGVISVVGMGGIGKTYIVQCIYNNVVVENRFDIRAWITVSHQSNAQAILLGLLDQLPWYVKENSEYVKENSVLGELLYKCLSGRRYFVVLDDLWDPIIFNEIVRYFPKDYNRSWIVITTRALHVANDVSSCSYHHHHVHLLNEVDSWELLRHIVFVEEVCPPELEKIGKTIARKCEGLPLTIHVIGKYLAEEAKEKKFWEAVAENVISIAATRDEKYLQVLSLSYDRLHHHLRPCFLYIGALSEGHEIRSSKLKELLVAEEFIKPLVYRTLERVADGYWKDLFERSLIFAGEKECPTGKVKSYSIHGVMRDISIRKAAHEKFSLVIKNGQALHVLEGPSHSIRRVIVHPNQGITDNFIRLKSITNSFVCTDYSGRLFYPLDFDASRLLRILDLLEIAFREFPQEIFKLINIRYLALTCYSNLPSEISKLLKLQTLIFRVDSDSRVEIPSTIWSLTQLRHFKFKDSYCWVEPGNEHVVLEKLHTFSYVDASMFTSSVFVKRLTSIRKLGLYWGTLKDNIDLRGLHKLETLTIYHLSSSPTGCLKFPSSVRKLTLSECLITGDFIAAVGSLPNLEVLKMRKCSFADQNMEITNAEWNLGREEFGWLKFLLLEDLNLVCWRVDDTLPSLERLVIRYCPRLEEIPSKFGQLKTLQMIEIDEWSRSAVTSARAILEEQRSYGNDILHVRFRGI